LSEFVIYLDESGDFGWNFTKPFGDGGSSRFFGIGALIVHKEDHFKVIGLLHRFYDSIGLKKPYPKELKASELDKVKRIKFLSEVDARRPQFKHFKFVFAYFEKSTMRSSKLKGDPNLIYNYLSKHCFLKEIVNAQSAHLIADARTVKIEAHHGFNDYLRTQLWAEFSSNCDLQIDKKNSEDEAGLQLADIFTNFAWRSHERAESTYIRKMSPYTSQSKIW
jgi:hypothetical protein